MVIVPSFKIPLGRPKIYLFISYSSNHYTLLLYTTKDHKSNFKTNPECRLINLAKTQIGRISKIIVQEICESLRRALNIN